VSSEETCSCCQGFRSTEPPTPSLVLHRIFQIPSTSTVLVFRHGTCPFGTTESRAPMTTVSSKSRTPGEETKSGPVPRQSPAGVHLHLGVDSTTSAPLGGRGCPAPSPWRAARHRGGPAPGKQAHPDGYRWRIMCRSGHVAWDSDIGARGIYQFGRLTLRVGEMRAHLIFLKRPKVGRARRRRRFW